MSDWTVSLVLIIDIKCAILFNIFTVLVIQVKKKNLPQKDK